MSRFSKTRRTSGVKNYLLILGFLALIAVFWLWTDSYSQQMVQRQKNNLENALRRNITTCYAQTGHYPESLEYIKDYYGLIYDDSMFFVDYQIQGQNLYPDVTIILLGE